MNGEKRTERCPLCGVEHPSEELMHGALIRGSVAELILKAHPTWSADLTICQACLNRFRAEYVEDALEAERGELSTLETEVVKSVKAQETLAENINVEFDRSLTAGQRIADRVAEFGGSWTFILSFGGILVLWLIVNSGLLLTRPFDPYPYILLNLVLSCLAALQAPIIMMSQNRQEAKDRLRAEQDYQVNLKAELEIRHLNWKLDQLLHHQWHRLLEIQRIQTELLQEVTRGRPDRATE